MPPAARDKYKFLSDQIAEEKQGIADQEARLEKAGAEKVPKREKEDPLQTAIKAAGWSYEPKKYDYRISPDGKAQRKAK